MSFSIEEAKLDETAAIQDAIDSGDTHRIRTWAHIMANKDQMDAAMELLETASSLDRTNLEIQRIQSGDYDDRELDEARDNEVTDTL